MRSLELHKLARLLAPAKRLLVISFLMDAAAGCMLLSVQFRAIDLGAPPMVLGLLGTASFLVYIAVSLFSGPLSDRLGRRPVTALAFVIAASTWLAMVRATSAYQLLALVTVSGGGLGLLWAPVQAWLGDLSGGSPRLLNRNIGLFNIAWSTGLMVGPLAAGPVYEGWGPMVFLIPTGAALLGLLMALLTPAGERGEAALPSGTDATPATVWVFLLMAWLGVFATSFARGLLGAMFPKLGDDLGYSPTLVGQLIFVLGAGQLVVFILTRVTRRWQHRLLPLILGSVLSLLAMVLAASTSDPRLFAAGFAVIGGGLGLTYVSGITYALQAGPVGRGRRAGIHEAIIGGGLVVGPLAGGILAQFINLRAPFVAAAGIYGLVVVGQLGLWLRRGCGGGGEDLQAETNTAALPPVGSG